MNIYALRHLRTSWNLEGLMQGLTDIEILPDDEVNRDFVLRLREQLDKIHPQLVLVSPLQRAIQSAEHLGLQFQIEPLIGEMSFGRFEGLPKKQMLEEMSDSWFGDPKSGELKAEFEELEGRIRLFLEKYKMYSEILIVSHGAFIRGLRSVVNTGSLIGMNEYNLDNGTLVVLKVD